MSLRVRPSESLLPSRSRNNVDHAPRSPHHHYPGRTKREAVHQGTRITVYDILEYLAGGTSQDQLLAEFPDLKPEHVRAALAFAAARERQLDSPPAA